MKIFTEEAYSRLIEDFFVHFPSFQKVGGDAFKPGLANMEFFDQLLGHPHRGYKTIHVAGTNGKGSVSNMLCSVFAAAGLKVGLYTSPHIHDFRERMRVLDGKSGGSYRIIDKKSVWDFINQWNSTFEHLGLSLFEITTSMAFDWFAKEGVDVAIIETGLGGRLDSTNIIMPELSVITNIGLDHCDILGDTLGEIAFEKAGIIQPRVPVVVGESNPETDEVFERKVLYTNLSEPYFMGDRKKIMSLLAFADKSEPLLWERREEILSRMDEQGIYQKNNLRTVLTSLQMLSQMSGLLSDAVSFLIESPDLLIDALVFTAHRTGFRGRWEILSDSPLTIADIGHNAHGLKYNFSQLNSMLIEKKCTHLLMVFGMVADKDIDSVFKLMPETANWFFTNASGKRALASSVLHERYCDYCLCSGRSNINSSHFDSVSSAIAAARAEAGRLVAEDSAALPLIYIGGSTFVVAEALDLLDDK